MPFDKVDLLLFDHIPAFLIAESNNHHKWECGRVKISSKGAIGLWQVKPCTAEYFNLKNPTVRQFDREYTADDLKKKTINQRVGYWYLRFCYERTGDLARAFSAYNLGHNSRDFNASYVSKILGGRNAEVDFSVQ